MDRQRKAIVRQRRGELQLDCRCRLLTRGCRNWRDDNAPDLLDTGGITDQFKGTGCDSDLVDDGGIKERGVASCQILERNRQAVDRRGWSLNAVVGLLAKQVVVRLASDPYVGDLRPLGVDHNR